MPQYYLPFPICQLSNVEFKYDLTIKKKEKSLIKVV